MCSPKKTCKMQNTSHFTIRRKIDNTVSCKVFKLKLILLRPREQLRSIVMGTSKCVSVCLFVCLSEMICPYPHARSLQNVLCMLPLWPCLGLSPASLRYVMYFRFCQCQCQSEIINLAKIDEFQPSCFSSTTGYMAVWISLLRTDFT